MKTKLTLPQRYWLIGALALVLLLLTACGSPAETWPGIASSGEDGTVIVTYRKQVTSLNADKSRNWTYPDEDEDDYTFYAPAVIAGGRIYVGDYKGNVHAIDAQSGERIWLYQPKQTKILGFTLGASDRVIGPVALGDGKLFFGNEHGLVALNIEGERPTEDWTFKTDHSVWAQPLYVDDESLGIEPTLFVASLDQHVYAIDPEDGSERWSVNLGASIPGGMTLDAQRQVLYVGTLKSELLAIRLTDGEVVARLEAEGWVWGNPLLFRDKLYFGDLKGYLYEVALTDDESVFGETFKRQLSSAPLRATPLIVPGLTEAGETAENVDVLVIGSEDGRVYAIDLTEDNWIQRRVEDVRWTKNLESWVVADLTWLDLPVVAEDGETIENERLIVVGTEEADRLIVALRLNDGGAQEWSYKYDD